MNASPAATPNLDALFDERLASWLEGAQKKINDHWTRSNFTHGLAPVLKMRRGTRFVIVTRHDRDKDGNEVPTSASAHAFIDITGGNIEGKDHKMGDVLKPASWKKPAKHARGNIFDADNGLNCMGEYGPAYLR